MTPGERYEADPRDAMIELSSAASAPIEKDSTPTLRDSIPALTVHFKCCGIVKKVYRSADGTHYLARCPKCARAATFRVGPGGTGSRTFVVE